MPKLKFPQIFLKMPRANGDVCAVDPALQDIPERLDIVGMNVAAHVLASGVLHALVRGGMISNSTIEAAFVSVDVSLMG